MGLFQSQLATDAKRAFLTGDGHDEQVVYKPFNGTARTINAIVDRNPPARLLPNGDVDQPTMTIEVANDAAMGISAPSGDFHGSDKVAVAYRPGGTAQDFGIYIPKDGSPWVDAGMITLDLK